MSPLPQVKTASYTGPRTGAPTSARTGPRADPAPRRPASAAATAPRPVTPLPAVKRAKTVLRPDVARRVRPARPVPVPVGGTEFIHLGTRVRPPRHVAMPTVRTRAVKRPSVWRTVGFFFGAITVSFTLHGLYYL